MTIDAEKALDIALAGFASQLAAGYSAWPPEFYGALLFFVIPIDGKEHVRTVQLAPDKPHLYSGTVEPADDNTPFLLFKLTMAELHALFSADDRAESLTVEGNEERLLQAIHDCLAAAM